jgi:hypothetical protein
MDSFGIELVHMTANSLNVTSTPATGDLPFSVDENEHVVTGGTTPAIAPTAPLPTRAACAEQTPSG